jgi:hypothetical protein
MSPPPTANGAVDRAEGHGLIPGGGNSQSARGTVGGQLPWNRMQMQWEVCRNHQAALRGEHEGRKEAARRPRDLWRP